MHLVWWDSDVVSPERCLTMLRHHKAPFYSLFSSTTKPSEYNQAYSVILVSSHSVFGFWFWTHLKFHSRLASGYILSHDPTVHPYNWPPCCFCLLALVHFFVKKTVLLLSSLPCWFLRLWQWWHYLKLSTRWPNNRDATLIRMFFLLNGAKLARSADSVWL